MHRRLLFILIVLFCKANLFATHIVGGEIFYDRINDSTYKVTVKIYRDCNTSVPFEGISDGGNPVTPAMLSVYTADSVLVDTFNLGVPVISVVPPSINNPCIQPPGGVCVEQGIYTYTLTLPPVQGGYFLVYQVVFRNLTVINLAAPNTQGATYFTFIPGPEVITENSSPRYDNFPPIFICNNVSFSFNHKATDPDGDQLVYSLCAPYNGQPGSPAPPPPYSSVNYAAPYTGSYPIASNPAFSIDASTGLLSGKPTLIGQFVVGVCVQEFRGNVLINTHIRDFQFNVVPCIVNVVSAIANQKSQCEGSTITFTNTSTSNIGNLTYHWDFGVPGIAGDTSNLFSPSYTFPDTGKYVVTLIANPNKPCSDTLKQTIYVYPLLNVSFPPAGKQCFRGNQFNFTTQGSYLPYATFNWDFTANATPPVSTLKDPMNIKFNQPGKYFVTLIAKQHSCIDTFIDSVRIIPPPLAKINNLPVQLCDPARVGFSNGSNSELPVTYEWSFSNGNTSNDFQPVQIFTPAGIYSATLIVKTTSVCIDTSMSAIHHITVNPSPQAGFTFSPQITTVFDPEITFVNNASSDVTWWDWSFGDGNVSNDPNNSHVYETYGDYVIKQTVMNSFYCTDTLSKLLKITPEYRFWIPNTFTPDGNKINDVFMPSVIGVEEYQFRIFTRWGEEIFFTENPKEGWSGSFRGKECEEGVYAWKIVFKNVVSTKNEVHYGHVLLLKNK